MGVGDMRVSGTCGCRGHEGVGDLYSGGLVCMIPANVVQKYQIGPDLLYVLIGFCLYWRSSLDHV